MSTDQERAALGQKLLESLPPGKQVREHLGYREGEKIRNHFGRECTVLKLLLPERGLPILVYSYNGTPGGAQVLERFKSDNEKVATRVVTPMDPQPAETAK